MCFQGRVGKCLAEYSNTNHRTTKVYLLLGLGFKSVVGESFTESWTTQCVFEVGLHVIWELVREVRVIPQPPPLKCWACRYAISRLFPLLSPNVNREQRPMDTPVTTVNGFIKKTEKWGHVLTTECGTTPSCFPDLEAHGVFCALSKHLCPTVPGKRRLFLFTFLHRGFHSNLPFSVDIQEVTLRIKLEEYNKGLKKAKEGKPKHFCATEKEAEEKLIESEDHALTLERAYIYPLRKQGKASYNWRAREHAMSHSSCLPWSIFGKEI